MNPSQFNPHYCLGNQRLWGSVSNGVHILVVGLLISLYGINVSFLIFFVGLVSFVLLSMLFVKFDKHMIHRSSRDNTNNSEEEDLEERSSLLAGKSTNLTGTNYMYDPSSTTWSHYTSHPPRPSRRESQQSQNTRRESIANTLYLSDDQLHTLTNVTTSLMAMDARIEANNELVQSNIDYPPLGLALSLIPTMETSMSAFALLGQEDEYGVPEKAILKSYIVYSFMISILLYGISHSMISQFLFLLLKDLGMSPSIIGWTGPIGGTAEVITFWLSRQVSNVIVKNNNTLRPLIFVVI